MTTTIDGIPPSTEIRARLAAEDRPVILSFSRGKDSIAAWLALRDAGIKVHAFYKFFLPGMLLDLERRSLAYFEDVFGQPIHCYQHPSTYRMLRNYVFQPPERWPIIRAANLPNLTYQALNTTIRSDLDLPADTWIADGVRACDSPGRRMAIQRHTPFRTGTGMVSPIWDWTRSETMQAIAKARIRLPDDYKMFGRSFDGIDLRFLAPLKKRFPDDYQLILDWFPLADLALFRADMLGKRI